MEVVAIAPAVLAMSLTAFPGSLKPPFLVYYRKGGISGLIENLIVYSDGTGIYRSDGEEIRGKVNGDTIMALEAVLNMISKRGFSEVSPRPGAVDFLYHEVIYPGRGERFAWVDEWASEVGLPREIRALTKLLDYAISLITGAKWVNLEESSTAYLRMRASLDGLVVRDGATLLLEVSVACSSEVEISYTLPTPDSPDVKIESDAEISVNFLRVEGRTIDEGKRKLLPGRRLNVEVSVELKEVERGLHWLSVHFPPKAPSIEVSLPFVIV